MPDRMTPETYAELIESRDFWRDQTNRRVDLRGRELELDSEGRKRLQDEHDALQMHQGLVLDEVERMRNFLISIRDELRDGDGGGIMELTGRMDDVLNGGTGDA